MDPADLTTHINTLTQTVQNLSKAVQELQLENRELRFHLTATSGASTKEPRINPPPIFSGERRKFREFIHACKLLFELNPITYPTERIRVRTTISYLDAEPRIWANTLLEKDDPALGSFNAFCSAMGSLYEDSDKQLSAGLTLRGLKQGKRPVEDYITEFKRWSAESEWNDAALKLQFHVGLSEPLKDDLAHYDLPPTCEELMKVSIRLDRRLRDRRAQRGSQLVSPMTRHQSPPTPTPMEIGAVRGPLTPTERARRRDNNLCLYCAGPDHLVDHCRLVKRKSEGECRSSYRLVNSVALSSNYLKLSLTLQWDQNRLPLEAMLDTGASGCFIDEEVIKRNKIPVCKKPFPLPVNVIDGHPLHSGPIVSQTLPLLVSTKHLHIESLVLDVIPSPLFPVILGLPWLLTHQPLIDWKNRTVEFNSPFCQSTCLRPSIITLAQTEENPTSEVVPGPYADFSDVFCPKLADTLPPHRPYDCPIDLLPTQTQTLIPATRIIASTLSLKDEILRELGSDSPPPHLINDAEGLLYKDSLLYIPPSLRGKILDLTHDSPLAGHPGIRRTLELLSRHFWWPGITQDVHKYVGSCTICARSKHSTRAPCGFLSSLPVPDKPWSVLSLDFIVDLPPSEGCNTILVVVDTLTKMAHFIPLPKVPNSKETAHALSTHVFKLHGLPSALVSDRGTQFTSQFWRALCQQLGITLKMSSAYHPQSNGQTERINQWLEQYIRCYCTHLQDNWFSLLALAEFSYNNTLSATTNTTPFFANYGFHPSFFPPAVLPTNNPSSYDYLQQIHDTMRELKVNISRAQERQKRFYDLRRRAPPSYVVGDMVWLSTRNLRLGTPSKKLSSLYIGPFPVSRVINPSAVRLTLPPHLRIHPSFHVSLLKPYVPDTYPDRVVPPAPPVDVQGNDEYEVGEVLDSRVHRRRLQYLIRWKGYGPQDDTWEPSSQVHAPRLVAQFHRRHPSKPAPPQASGVGLLRVGSCKVADSAGALPCLERTDFRVPGLQRSCARRADVTSATPQ